MWARTTTFFYESYNLQKGTQFHRVEYIGANGDVELDKGIIVFMITGLKNKVTLVIKVSSAVTVNGEWISQKILKCIFQIINTGFFLLGLTIIQPVKYANYLP